MADGLSELSELMRDERVPEREPVDPERRRRRRRRRLLVGGIVTTVVLALAATYAGYTLTAPVGAADASSRVPEAPAPEAATIAMSPEGASAISISGGEAYLGPDASGIWMASGGDDARPIASISKLITALVVLDAKPLASADDVGPTITFSKADHALYDKYYVLGATIAAMPTGSTMSERDALETMLIPSASNYAEAIAGWAFGSQSSFAAAAKRWLAANGLTHTTIVEPTGIDARNTSTPSDLIALARIVVADPTVSAITAMPTLSVPGMDAMPNTNDLLGSYGITGLKTGTLEASGSNLLFSGTMTAGDDVSLDFIGVVLGGYTRQSVDADVAALLNSIAAGFHEVPLGASGQEVGTYTTPWGESAQMVLGETASIFTWSDTPIEATMRTTPLTTGADGEKVGSVTWTTGPNSVTVPVVLEGSISPPDQWWRLTHPFELGG
jgi:D-alanyl-D-alanine carboxypeptidase (penicillin-binding protein 5/6)